MSRLAGILLLLAASLALCAQTTSADTKPADYVARAKQFLRTLYPDLDPAMPVTIDANRLGDSDILNVFQMRLDLPEKVPTASRIRSGGKVYQLVEPSPCPTDCLCSNPALSADFGFDSQTASKDLFMAWVSGPLVNCRVDQLAKEVSKHPGWSEARILAALREAGPKFGPDHRAEFLQALPLDKLKPFTGEIKVTSTEFQARQLTWVIRGKWGSPDRGTEADCFLSFEPFEGRLTAFDRHNVPHESQGK